MMLTLGLAACGKTEKKTEVKEEKVEVSQEEQVVAEEEPVDQAITKIVLSNSEILVNEEKISEDAEADIYKANDIIFYLEGQGIAYGEGTAKDEHSQIEADAHTVVHITKPGTYEISGTMDAGQIFVDLGDGAKKNPDAVVTLILNDADITCTVAPAILFYNVYECDTVADEEKATMEIDTSAAGANIQIADDTKNKIYGSYVAKIFESVDLNEDGTEVIDSKKLYKFDGAVYSKRSMNVYGDTGKLSIIAENEGLCSEMHLTIHGGNLDIKSGNDGINTSEDNVSVFAMNNGNLKIQVTGETGEGDGIDSNGWILVNGGTVNAWACGTSADSGIDADRGIYLNGGTVVASGNMRAELSDGVMTAVTFMCRQSAESGETYEVKDADGNVLMEVEPENTFTMLVAAAEEMTAENQYSLWLGDEKISDGMSGDMMKPGMPPEGMPPEGMPPEGMMPPENFEGVERPPRPEKKK